jgi:hypothetical protein
MQRVSAKDIFFVHSKRAYEQYRVVKLTTSILERFGYSIWKYEDWDWEHETEEVIYSRTGRHLDIRRLITGHPKSFKHTIQDEEVDLELLREILLQSRVIVVLLQGTKLLTEGVLEELSLIRQQQRYTGHRYILCTFDNMDPTLPYPLDFDDSISIPLCTPTLNPDPEFMFPLEEFKQVDMHYVETLSVMIARHVLEVSEDPEDINKAAFMVRYLRETDHPALAKQQDMLKRALRLR